MTTPAYASHTAFIKALTHFFESDIAKRILQNPDADIKPAAFTACAAIVAASHARPDKPRPHVRVIAPPDSIYDQGAWLDPRLYGFPPFASLEIIIPPAFHHLTRSDIFPKSDCAAHVAHYPRPRARQIDETHLFDQILKADVTIFLTAHAIFAEKEIPRSFLSALKPGHLVFIPFPTSMVRELVALTNHGLELSERTAWFVINPDGSGLFTPVYLNTGLVDPPESPLCLPPTSNDAINAPRQFLEPFCPEGGVSDPDLIPAVKVTSDAYLTINGDFIDEDGEKIDCDIVPPAIHQSLPPYLSLADAALRLRPSETIDIDGIAVPLPPINNEKSREFTAKLRDLLTKRIRELKPEDFERQDNHGRTLIHHLAMSSAPLPLLSSSINLGFEPDLQDEFGWTPAVYAAYTGQSEKLELFNGLIDPFLTIVDGVTVEDALRHFGYFDFADEQLDFYDEGDDEFSQEHSDWNTPNPSILAPYTPKPAPTSDAIPLPASPVLDARPLSVAPLTTQVGSPSPPADPVEGPEHSQTPPAHTSASAKLTDADLSALLPAPSSSVPKHPLLKEADASRKDKPSSPRQASEVVPVFATALQLPPTVDPLAIRREIAKWAIPSADLAKLDATLPSFESADRVILSDEDPASGLWALRFDHNTPAFVFRSEFVIYPTAGSILLSARLFAIRVPGTDDDLEPSVPRIIQRFAELGATHCGLPVGKIIRVSSQDDVNALRSIIFNPDRSTPLLAIYGDSADTLSVIPPNVRAAFILVHVPPSHNTAVMRAIGRDFIGYHGAIRIYPPGLKSTSPRYDAPLIMSPHDIPPPRLNAQIRHTLWRLSASITEDDAPTYLDARRLILARVREAQAKEAAALAEAQALLEAEAKQKAEALALAKAESLPLPLPEPTAPEPEQIPEPAPAIADAQQNQKVIELTERVHHLEAQIAEFAAKQEAMARRHASDLEAVMKDLQLWQDLAEQESAKAAGYQQERDQLRRDVFALRQQLTPSLSSDDAQPEDQSSDQYPDSFDALDTWVKNEYPGRVHIASKAIRAAKAVNSEPDIVRQAYLALDILATDYLDLRSGDQSARDRLAERLKAARLDISKVGIAVNHRLYADEYQCTVGGKRFELDMHVKELGSTSFNPTRQLRIYFAYDAKEQRIIVGHLPTHLTSTLS